MKKIATKADLLRCLDECIKEAESGNLLPPSDENERKKETLILYYHFIDRDLAFLSDGANIPQIEELYNIVKLKDEIRGITVDQLDASLYPVDSALRNWAKGKFDKTMGALDKTTGALDKSRGKLQGLSENLKENQKKRKWFWLVIVIGIVIVATAIGLAIWELITEQDKAWCYISILGIVGAIVDGLGFFIERILDHKSTEQATQEIDGVAKNLEKINVVGHDNIVIVGGQNGGKDDE